MKDIGAITAPPPPPSCPGARRASAPRRARRGRQLDARDRGRGHAAGEHTAAEERALERALAVQAAAAEAGRLADRVEAVDRLPVARAQHAATEIGLDPAQALARHGLQADRDERHRLVVDDALELRGPQAVAAPVAQ